MLSKVKVKIDVTGGRTSATARSSGDTVQHALEDQFDYSHLSQNQPSVLPVSSSPHVPEGTVFQVLPGIYPNKCVHPSWRKLQGSAICNSLEFTCRRFGGINE